MTYCASASSDPTHGSQELAFFNGHSDTWCYLPRVAPLTFTDEAEAYLVAIVLRPGNSPATPGALGLWRTLLHQRRAGGLLGEASGLSKDSGRTEHVYGETL